MEEKKCLRVSIHPDIWACGNMSNIFETVEASRQKELILVCTENPVTIQHVKVDYRFLIHPIMPLQKKNK